MFEVFINASDSLFYKSSQYRFVTYDTFKQILDHLLINKSSKEKIVICYSSYINVLESYSKRYVEESSTSLGMEQIPASNSPRFCETRHLDGFIIFKNNAPDQCVTNELIDSRDFEKIPKKIIYIDKDGNILDFKDA